MVGILQVNGQGEESTLMQDLKPFRILISLLDKPELGNFHLFFLNCFMRFCFENFSFYQIEKVICLVWAG